MRVLLYIESFQHRKPYNKHNFGCDKPYRAVPYDTQSARLRAGAYIERYCAYSALVYGACTAVELSVAGCLLFDFSFKRHLYIYLLDQEKKATGNK